MNHCIGNFFNYFPQKMTSTHPNDLNFQKAYSDSPITKYMIETFSSFPRLNWKDSFLNIDGQWGLSNAYITKIQLEDMTDPFMQGTDHKNRPFVAFKTCIEGLKPLTEQSCELGNEAVQVFHKLYSVLDNSPEINDRWVSVSQFKDNSPMPGINVLQKEPHKVVGFLVNHQTFSTSDNHSSGLRLLTEDTCDIESISEKLVINDDPNTKNIGTFPGAGSALRSAYKIGMTILGAGITLACAYETAMIIKNLYLNRNNQLVKRNERIKQIFQAMAWGTLMITVPLITSEILNKH